MMPKVYTKFISLSASAGVGTTQQNIIDGPVRRSGYLREVTVVATSGGGASADISVTYNGPNVDNNRAFTVYTQAAAGLPTFNDAGLDLPFSTHGNDDVTNLDLNITPIADGNFTIRLDFELIS